MLIVISSPTTVSNEAGIINRLFDEGLPVLHLRKPESSVQDLELVLQKINPIHYSKIALHQHHDLARKFGINRLHLTENDRKKMTERELSNLSKTYVLSTSVHNVTDYEHLPACFAYSFLSPVFDSISKPGLKSGSFDVKGINKRDSIKLIALGGIDSTNCMKAREMGFDGIALLGAVWSGENELERFKKAQEKWATTVQL